MEHQKKEEKIVMVDAVDNLQNRFKKSMVDAVDNLIFSYVTSSPKP
jgi:hypothetical protein